MAHIYMVFTISSGGTLELIDQAGHAASFAALAIIAIPARGSSVPFCHGIVVVLALTFAGMCLRR